MNFSNDLDLTISLQLTEEDAAKEAGAGLNQGVALAKQMGPLLAGGAPPELGPGLQGLLSSTPQSKEYRARDIVRALRAAAKDSRIKAVVFDLSGFQGGEGGGDGGVSTPGDGGGGGGVGGPGEDDAVWNGGGAVDVGVGDFAALLACDLVAEKEGGESGHQPEQAELLPGIDLTQVCVAIERVDQMHLRAHAHMEIGRAHV